MPRRRVGESAVAANTHDFMRTACGSLALAAVRRTLLLRTPRSPYLAATGVVIIRQRASVAICGLCERSRCEAHRRGCSEKSERRFVDHGLPSRFMLLVAVKEKILINLRSLATSLPAVGAALHFLKLADGFVICAS